MLQCTVNLDCVTRDPKTMLAWTPDLSLSDLPRYLAIADAIALDVRAGDRKSVV